MEVMGERVRPSDSTMWGGAHTFRSHKEPGTSLHRSESAPQSILEEFQQSSRRPGQTRSRSQSVRHPTDFLDFPDDEQRQVTFGMDTMFLEDDDTSDFLSKGSALRSSATATGAGSSFFGESPARQTSGQTYGDGNIRRSGLGSRPPTQPSSGLGSRRHPSRSVSSFELAAILNDNRKHGLPTSSTSACMSGHEATATSSNPFWPKSVFDMIQDDFPRTPSPMLNSLVPSKTVSTARELRNVQLHPRVPPTQRRARTLSSAGLDRDYEVFLNNPRSSTNVDAAPSDDLDVIFGTRDESHATSKTASTLRGHHRRSASINWTGDLPGLFQDRAQSPTSPLKSSKSSCLFPTFIDASPSPQETALNSRDRFEDDNITPPGSRNGVLPQASRAPSSSSVRPASPIKPHIPTNVRNEPEVHRMGGMSTGNAQHCSFPVFTESAHVPNPTEHGSDFNYFHDRQDGCVNPALATPHLQNTQAYAATGDDNLPSSMHQPNASENSGLYSQDFRSGMTPNNELRTMSMQMAMFLHQQHQLYMAQIAQMAAISGTQFTGNMFEFQNMINHFPSHLNSSTAQPWNNLGQHRNVPRSARGFVDSSKKKDFNGGKGKGSRGRKGNRHSYDPDHGRSGFHGYSADGFQESQVRSQLLENFRFTSVSIGRDLGGNDSNLPSGINSINAAGVSREWTLGEIKDHVVEFSTDQHGSRFIQQKLEMSTDEEKHAVLVEAMVEAQRLMTDVFGNYVIQKLLDFGGEAAISSIASELEGRMLSLSLHMYGCRVVQKALEVVESDYRSRIVRELDGHVLKCIRDQNGNHVIQKCVELVESNAVQFIVDAVLGQAVHLASHSYGCRVVQRILEYGAPDQKKPIMREIMAAIPDLIQDQYGNYVIQHIVEHGVENERAVIMRLVRAEVCDLSQHKFASNVVERCLQFGSSEEREILVEKLIVGDGSTSTSPLNGLVRDQFGNYVVQRVLDVANPVQRERVTAILKTQVSAIKKYSYGKHIIARLEDPMPNFSHVPAFTYE